MFLPRFLFALLCVLPMGVWAHEFWIEPIEYQIASGGTVQGHFKNGQAFEGGTLSFFDRSSERFEMRADGKTIALSPRAGDSPALNVEAPIAEGLISVVHETAPSSLTYTEWAKFMKFAAHKDFANAAKDHMAAGWPQDKFKESYTRHVKTLIAVGNGEGQDSEAGMKTEFVALTNPYADDFNHVMKVKLLLEGAPRADAQVEVFERDPEGEVTITLFRTDGAGTALVPVQKGREYLFDAVVLQAVDDVKSEANPLVWETYWAALTFKVPQ